MELAPLEGWTVAVTADRRAQEQIDLLERQGADVLHAPTIGTTFFEDSDQLRAATTSVIARPPDVLVANTGIGMRSWFDATSSWGLTDALVESLRTATILARGPKAAGAVRRVGLNVDRAALSERLEEVAALLGESGVAGRRVLLQLDGSDDAWFREHLESLGAEVVTARVYRWRPVPDPEPVDRLIDAVLERRVDAVTFTSAPALRNLLELAGGRQASLVNALNSHVDIACVGPVCAEAAATEGLSRVAAPDLGRLGGLIRTVVDTLSSRRRVVRLGGANVVAQGRALRIAERKVRLSPQERLVFDALVEASGKVVTKQRLETLVWGDVSAKGHRLHVTVGRLRDRLGPVADAIEPVHGRGYRIAA